MKWIRVTKKRARTVQNFHVIDRQKDVIGSSWKGGNKFENSPATNIEWDLGNGPGESAVSSWNTERCPLPDTIPSDPNRKWHLLPSGKEIIKAETTSFLEFFPGRHEQSAPTMRTLAVHANKTTCGEEKSWKKNRFSGTINLCSHNKP